MIINSQNIEKWFFDYFEGELTVLERKELEQFVLNHPEYQDDFKSWSESYASDNDIPAYIAPIELYAKVAFYETTTFRVAASLLTLLTLSVAGLWNFTELSNLSSQKEEVTYFKKDYSINTILPYSFAFLSKEGIDDLTLNNSNLANNSVTSFDPLFVGNQSVPIPVANIPSQISAEKKTNINNGGQLTNGINKTNQLVVNEVNDIAFAKVKLKKSPKLLSEANQDRDVKRMDDYQLKFLQKDRHYKFLDFRNSSVKGVSTLIKDNREKSSNVAEISESESSRNSSNSKKSLIDKIRKLDLGLTNINDPIFEIANYQPLTLNPSLAGQLGFTRFKSFYRNQWLGTQHNTQIGGVSIDSYINQLKAGVALNAQTTFFNSSSKATTLSFVYSQKFELKKEQSISATVEYTLLNVESNNTLQSSIEIAPSLFLSQNRLNALKQKDVWHNLGISSFYNGKYFYGGVNVSNILGNSLTTNEQNGAINNLNYSIQLGTDYKKSFYSNFVIAPYVVFNKFGDQKECWLGTSLRYKGLIVGATGSTAKSAKVFGGLQSAKFRVVYGFDINKSDALGNYFGNHEISLRILLGSKYNNWSR